jgi:hypothetical protein
MTVDGETSEERELVVALAEMTDEATAIATEVRDLKAFGLRNRSLIKWVGACIVLCLVLAAGLIWAMVEVRRVGSTTRQVCAAANERNVVQRHLWDGVLGALPDTDASAELRAQVVPLLDEAFTHVDCDGE